MVTYIPRKRGHVLDTITLAVLGMAPRERVGKVHNDGFGHGPQGMGRRARRIGIKSKRTRGGRR